MIRILMDVEVTIKEKYLKIKPELNERSLRIWLAVEANALGRGGISKVSRATKVSRNTILKGIKELEGSVSLPNRRIRKIGGGRRKNTQKDQKLKEDLDLLIEPATRGDPESPLRWVSKSLRHISKELENKKHKISHTLVGKILKQEGYSLQANKKSKEGTQHPDRNAQFEHINQIATEFIKNGSPIISVDTKKKELVGDFKNTGREWRLKGNPRIVRMHDFQLPKKGKIAPYGVYDLNRNEGWVNVGINHDTAEFAVESIRQWWKNLGRKKYRDSKKIFITADCGGSNGYRSRLWKRELQKFAEETGLTVAVSHFPPGTSKWNKIEHKLFSFISMNWRGKPLYDHATVIQLITATTTQSGLKVYARIDQRKYEKGIKVTDEELAKINLHRNQFHGEWNYTISPQLKN